MKLLIPFPVGPADAQLPGMVFGANHPSSPTCPVQRVSWPPRVNAGNVSRSPMRAMWSFTSVAGKKFGALPLSMPSSSITRKNGLCVLVIVQSTTAPAGSAPSESGPAPLAWALLPPVQAIEEP